jgi:hypothetical protein|nr:MAG TPA: tail sheath protein [Caudoviricetes sp.]
MAKKKIRVTVVRPKKPLLLGDFGKVLFITKEADKDYKKYTSLEEVGKDFGKNSKMYKGIEVFLSQEDFDGNVIQPSEWYCVSKATPDAAFLDTLPTGDFYGVVVDFFDETFTLALAKWLTRNVKFGVVANSLGKNNKAGLKESTRIYFMHGKATGENLDIFGLPAWTFAQGINGRWADRRILGVEPSTNDETLQSDLSEAHINYTYTTIGYNAVTSGSWCADGERHADQTIKIDAIVHSIDSNLKKLLINEKNLTMDGGGIPKVEGLLDRVMLAMGKQGAIARDSNGNYIYKITVPSIEDDNPQTGLTDDDFIKRTLRNVRVDFMMSAEIEEIEVELVWHDGPLK